MSNIDDRVRRRLMGKPVTEEELAEAYAQEGSSSPREDARRYMAQLGLESSQDDRSWVTAYD